MCIILLAYIPIDLVERLLVSFYTFTCMFAETLNDTITESSKVKLDFIPLSRLYFAACRVFAAHNSEQVGPILLTWYNFNPCTDK